MAAIADIGGLVASVESAESPPETLPVPVQVLWLVHKADFRTEVRFHRCRECHLQVHNGLYPLIPMAWH